MKDLIGKIIYEINDENRIDKHKIVDVIQKGLSIRLKLVRIKDGAKSNPDLLINLNRFLFLEKRFCLQGIEEIESCQ